MPVYFKRSNQVLIKAVMNEIDGWMDLLQIETIGDSYLSATNLDVSILCMLVQ